MHACRLTALTIALTAPLLLVYPAPARPAAPPGPAPALTPASAAEVLRAVRAPGARAVLVNVWATWCLPCREEMPDLLRLRRDYAERGVRLILVSGDFSGDAGEAAAFLGEQGVDFPTYLKKGPDMEFIDAFDPKWSGALPATFIYDADGHLRHSIHGVASYDQLEEKLRNVLK
jgi:thiol-disulfide isomerase/thioredoxin